MTEIGPRSEFGDRGRWLVLLSIVLALAGIAAFCYLFLRHLTVYGIILAPVILALYMVPAVFVFWLAKRRRRGWSGKAGEQGGQGGPGATAR
ncbi:MAG TPA: hypothetical protein VMS75_06260 [Terriglobales bacterium]|nr:hypothetical protein [Terriglobales bacterium]